MNGILNNKRVDNKTPNIAKTVSESSFLQNIHQQNMEAIGVEPKSSEFFESLPTFFTADTDYKIYELEIDESQACAILVFYHKDTIVYFTPALAHEFRNRQPLSALIYTIMVLKVPNSPRWLALQKKDDVAALKVLELIYSKENAQQHLDEIKIDQTESNKSENVFQKKFSRVLWLGFFIAFFNQLSGINFVLYYAPEILEQAGLGGKESLFNSIAIGIVNLIFTIIGVRLLDKLGRRQLIIIGSFGYIISLVMVGLCFQMDLGSTLTLIFICSFVASHAIGQGAVIWVFISEIYPNSVRAYGQSWGVSIHWVFAAIITLITPFFLDASEGVLRNAVWYIYYFFGAMMVLQLIWAITKMPETKGMSLEALSKKLLNK